MHPSRRTIPATSGLLAMAVVICVMITAIVLIAPALHALAQTVQALAAVLN